MDKEKAFEWFQQLQRNIAVGLEALENTFHPGQTSRYFKARSWKRQGGGGGTMALLQGHLFEKAGVNFSCVFGQFSPEMQAHVPGATEDPSFWASGVSLVIHPRSPHVPIIHMNTRHIITRHWWFGGGIDLTPTVPVPEDTHFFHNCLQRVCDPFDPTYYPRFKAWADDYFFLPHRNEPRGVGGIFYDNLNSASWDEIFAFNQAIGSSFLDIYSPLVRNHWHQPWDERDKSRQLHKRGRYVEFNLIHDRGTLFGLKTDGNIDAILMSLPPHAAWPVPEGLEDTLHEKAQRQI